MLLDILAFVPVEYCRSTCKTIFMSIAQPVVKFEDPNSIICPNLPQIVQHLGLAELFQMAEVQSRPAGAARGRGRGRRALEEGGKKLADGEKVKRTFYDL